MCKRFAVLLTLCALLLVTGCTTTKNISTPEVKDLTKELKRQYEQLKKVEIRMQPTRIEWILTWKETPEDRDSMGAFESIRNYVVTDDFKQNVVIDLYMEEFASVSEYPDVHITYDMNNDKTFDRRFASSYDENQGYANWYYSKDYRSEADLLK